MWAGQLPSHMGKVALRMTAMQRAQVIRKGVLTSHLADPSGPPVHCLSCWRKKETVVWNSGTYSQVSLLYKKVFMTLLSPF